MSLSIPYTFTGGAGNKAKASEVNANFQAVANKFTEGAGGIADGDIAAAAGIKGTKISNTLGNRIPYDRLEPNAVDSAALRSSAGGTNGAVATADHIKDGIITSAKGKLISANSVTLDNAALFNAATVTGEQFSKLVTTGVSGGGTLYSIAIEKISGSPLNNTSFVLVPYLTSAGVLTFIVGWLAAGTSPALSGYRVKWTYWSAT